MMNSIVKEIIGSKLRLSVIKWDSINISNSSLYCALSSISF